MTPPRLKWILAEPSGGLCNRLRTLVSCQILAESTGSRVQLLWRPRPNCRCRFSDLFRNDRSLKVVPPRYQRASRRIGLPRFPRVRAGDGRSLSQEDLAELGWVIDPQPLRVGSSLHFDGQGCPIPTTTAA